jgi:hypothetical protein
MTEAEDTGIEVTAELAPQAPAADRPIPRFLQLEEPARYIVLVNKDVPASRLIQAPISMQELLAAAEKLGALSQVMVMVPQNPEGT